MTYYLNTDAPFELFKRTYNGKYFVDKSEILTLLNERIDTDSNYVCITKPRRFGKTVMTNLIASYYCKGFSSKEVFDNLKISNNKEYLTNLNKHNVIFITFNEMPRVCNSYHDYIENIESKLIKDIKEVFPNIDIDENDAIWTILKEVYQTTKEGFVFIIDEWDYLFNNNKFINNQDDFLQFLMNLLKDQPYVKIAYMTGILPIKKYSSGSALNMFKEYDMINDKIFSKYFGFTDNEVKKLCLKNSVIKYEELREWYNGYYSFDGERIYNPRSVKSALEDNYCKSYWTETGPFDEVSTYIKYNVKDVREEIVKMVSKIPVKIKLKGFSAGQKTPSSKEEILSAMVVYGFLSYNNEYLKIPNKELMEKFEEALDSKDLGYTYTLIQYSDRMLQATLAGDTVTMAKILQYTHDTESTILKYNDENSLSCIVNLIYLNSRNEYRMEREASSGCGYVDFIFYPLDKRKTGFILELKVDSTVEKAIKQIKEKRYFTKFAGYSGKLLAVGMNYDKKKKEHKCLVEDITNLKDNIIE